MMYIKIYYLFSFIFPLVKLSFPLGQTLTCPWLNSHLPLA